jgi:hypothetical protein
MPDQQTQIETNAGKGLGFDPSKAPPGTYTATLASIGAAFGGWPAIIGGAIGAMIDAYNILAKPSTQVIGWSAANATCGPIADKITAELVQNLSADQFNDLARNIEDRAIDLIRKLETNLTPLDYQQRVERYINDINAARNTYVDNYTRVRSTIWRFLMQRVEYFAVADVKTALPEAIGHRLRVLVYDYLKTKGYITSTAAIDSGTETIATGTGFKKFLPLAAAGLALWWSSR